MLDPKKGAELDQAAALAAEHFPRLWRSIYTNCIEQGFSENEAMELVKTYIMAQHQQS